MPGLQRTRTSRFGTKLAEPTPRRSPIHSASQPAAPSTLLKLTTASPRSRSRGRGRRRRCSWCGGVTMSVPFRATSASPTRHREPRERPSRDARAKTKAGPLRSIREPPYSPERGPPRRRPARRRGPTTPKTCKFARAGRRQRQIGLVARPASPAQQGREPRALLRAASAPRRSVGRFVAAPQPRDARDPRKPRP